MAINIESDSEDRATLEGWVADRNTPQKLVWRSRIVLLSADRVGKMAIVRAVGKCKRTVDRWQERYVARGLAGLQRDATRRGRKPPLAAAMIERAVKTTLHEKPPAATHWSAHTLAKALGTASARPDAPPLFVPPLAFLQKHFGANYISYKGKVRRWI